ncbi:pre-rRNA-processing protein esf1 [Dermatophagoides farinae]|uniref:Pre-rRNA-processing protein esf1 n=1 Tax=Dermatophagoides farinae TaxID=6954 RepID=A0A922L3U4_DERFA|nr:pre-rRNA-processing protein esf1 [Dermatophagoides farinae]
MANKNKKDEIDDRFAKVYQDPRFRTLRKKDKMLKIDKRFKSMFTDDKFTLKYSMDKRGKPKNHLIAEDYKEFYQLDEEGIDEPKEQEKIDEKTEDIIDRKNDFKMAHEFGYHRGLKIKTNDNDDDDDDQEGEEDESSSSSSESEDDVDDEELEHDWGELDKDAQQIDHSTSRIAICNADWDRINAQDLYILLNSFKRNTGTIHSVRIYYSKFGEERLQVEEEKGPSDFIFGKGQKVAEIYDDDDDDDNEQQIDQLDDNDDGEDENEDEEIKDPNTVEKLRKYQLERLKYFYAVIECDSAETAESICNELDGLEYESSSTLLDIRFIPDDMDFDDVRLKEECTTMPTSSTYKAPSFTNTALQQSTVKITWDETDPRRKEAFNKAFEENNENDIKTYLATSSDDDDDENDTTTINIDENMQENDKINKYKDLLLSLEKENEKEDFDMEVTWDPKLKSKTENLLNKRTKSNDSDEINLEESVSESDDEKEEIDFPKIENSKRNKKRQKNKFDVNEVEPQNPENDANLELLMMDVDETNNNSSEQKRKHFNYKNIVEKYNAKTKTDSVDDDDDDDNDDGFKFNPDDNRFSSIYESHLYNVDQSDPQFKRTKAFEQILAKQKQKAHRMVENESEFMMNKSNIGNTKSVNLNNLVDKIKNKAKVQFKKERPTKSTMIMKNQRYNVNKKFKS